MSNPTTKADLRPHIRECTDRISALREVASDSDDKSRQIWRQFSGHRVGESDSWRNTYSLDLRVRGEDEEAWRIVEEGRIRRATTYIYIGSTVVTHLQAQFNTYVQKLLSYTDVDDKLPHRVDVNTDFLGRGAGIPYLPSGSIDRTTGEVIVQGLPATSQEFMQVFNRVGDAVSSVLSGGPFDTHIGGLVLPGCVIGPDREGMLARTSGPFTLD